MSQKEMDQMDQECENVVNSSAAPEAMATAEAIAEEWYEESMTTCEPDPCCGSSPRSAAKALVDDLKKEAKNRLRRQLAVRIILCLLSGIFFVAALVEPKLIVWLVNVGVLCCGIVAAVSIDRHCRR